MVPYCLPDCGRNNSTVSVRTASDMSKNTIAIHLPDGAVREVPAGTTPLEIANSISPRLAAASVVVRLTPLAANGALASDAKPAEGHSSEASMYAVENSAAPRLVDLSTPLAEDA